MADDSGIWMYAVADRMAPEWFRDVAGLAGEPATVEGFPQAGRSGTGGTGPGAAFLRRRRTQLTARDNARQTVAADAEKIHLALDELAVASYARPPQDPKLTGHAEWMVLN